MKYNRTPKKNRWWTKWPEKREREKNARFDLNRSVKITNNYFPGDTTHEVNYVKCQVWCLGKMSFLYREVFKNEKKNIKTASEFMKSIKYMYIKAGLCVALFKYTISYLIYILQKVCYILKGKVCFSLPTFGIFLKKNIFLLMLKMLHPL